MHSRRIVLAAGVALSLAACDVECPPGTVSVEKRCLTPDAAAALDGGTTSAEAGPGPTNGDGGTRDDGSPGSRGDGSSPVTDASQTEGLLALEISAGALVPPFDPTVRSYTVDVPTWIRTVRFRPIAAAGEDQITVNGTASDSGAWSDQVILEDTTTTATLEVTSGSVVSRYEISIEIREPVTVELRPSNDDADDDAFGNAVALSRNGDWLMVGAPFDDGTETNPRANTASNSGAVFVYQRNGSTWSQQSYIKSPEFDGSLAFGSSLSLSCDGSILAVSELRSPDDSTCDSCSVVRVLERNGTSWNPSATLVEPTPTENELFTSMNMSCDGSRLIVGTNRYRTLVFDVLSTSRGIETRLDGFGDLSGAGSTVAVRYEAELRLFQKSGNAWTSGTPLSLSSLATSVTDVALSYDGHVVAVGASGEIGNDGTILAYRYSGDRWRETRISSPLSQSGMGDALVVVNQGDVIIASADRSGHLIPFSWINGSWRSETPFLVNSDPDFGPVLAGSADGSTLALASDEDRVTVRYLP